MNNRNGYLGWGDKKEVWDYDDEYHYGCAGGLIAIYLLVVISITVAIIIYKVTR